MPRIRAATGDRAGHLTRRRRAVVGSMGSRCSW
jgi:hypothetical protein